MSNVRHTKNMSRLLLFIAVIQWVLTSPLARAETLCDSADRVYFSCKTKKNKFLSVCHSAYGDQYRYGTREHLELVFPKNESEASREYSVIGSATQNYSPEREEIHFNTGTHRYTVINVASKSKRDGKYHVFHAGVFVFELGAYEDGSPDDRSLGFIPCIIDDSNFVRMKGWGRLEK